MTKKALEVKEKRVSIGPLVLPETKVALGAAAKAGGVSIGAVIDGAMKGYVAGAEAAGSVVSEDHVIALAEAIEEAAVLAGICNGEVELGGPELLMLCQDLGVAAKRGVERVEGIPASPWARTTLKKLAEFFDESEQAAIDRVVQFYDDILNPKRPDAEAAPAKVAALPVFVAGDALCACAHCGETFMGRRFATICPGCFVAGHRGAGRDCEICGAGQGL